MRCRLLWWSSVTGDSSRGNRTAFENIGVKTESITRGINPQVHLQYGADFIFTGMIYEMVNWAGMGLAGKIPSIVQGGGYGPYILPDGKFERGFENVTKIPKSIITILDPNYYFEMKNSGLPFEFDKIFLVPNGLSMALTQFPAFPQKKGEDEFIVFNPSGNFWIKHPERFIEATQLVYEREPKIKFQFPIKTRFNYNAPIKWLKCENVDLMPVKSQPQMFMMYQKADVVGVYSEAEILPTHFFEALWFNKPLIHSRPGMVQSVPLKCLKKMTGNFGLSITDFHRKWKNKYLKGEHFWYVKSPKEFADAVIALYNDKVKRDDLAKKGNDFVMKWYSAEDKCELLVNMLRNRNLVGGD